MFRSLSFADLRHKKKKKNPCCPDVGSTVKVHSATWWNNTHITLLPTAVMVKQVSQTQTWNVDKVTKSRETGTRVAGLIDFKA